MSIFLNFLFLLLYLNWIRANEFCSGTDFNKCNRSKNNIYSKEFNTNFSKYLQLINDAKKRYIPCETSGCKCFASQISKDLAVFKATGITKDMFDRVKSKGTKYQIINNKLFRDKNCMFPARCSGIEYFLLKLLPKLHDTEFIINTRDWPQIHKNHGTLGPVLSFSKTNEYHDVMYPAWAFWEGGPAISLYPRGIGRWDLHRKQLAKIGNETTWAEKASKGFFRGSRTSSERDPLVYLSIENPDLVDARYTKNQAWKSDADTLNQPPAKEVSFEHHCNYKYLFNFRGVAASFRFKHALLCKSLVFHVGNEWQEFFYGSLTPWFHYIPIDGGAGEEKLKEMLNFAIENDQAVEEIARNGHEIIWNKLKMGDILCYWKMLINSYTDLIKYRVELDSDLVQINN